MPEIQIGSISSGTLRSEDLLPVFADELKRLDPENELLPELAEPRAVAIYTAKFGDSDERIKKAYPLFWDSDKATDLIRDVEDALQNIAPVHMYFGTAEGDGADFGWWPDADFDGCHTVQVEESKPLQADSSFVDVTCKVYVEVNDHGNITVRELGGETIWDCV